jgi:hypothetical protein
LSGTNTLVRKEWALANRAKEAAPTYVTTCVVDAYLNLDCLPTNVLKIEPFSKTFYDVLWK